MELLKYVITGLLIGVGVTLPFALLLDNIELIRDFGLTGAFIGFIFGIVRLGKNGSIQPMSKQQQGLLVGIGIGLMAILAALLRSSSSSYNQKQSNTRISTHKSPSSRTVKPSTTTKHRTTPKAQSKPSAKTCSRCSGRGNIKETISQKCTGCNGTGKVKGQLVGNKVKPGAHPYGVQTYDNCTACRGTGKKTKSQQVTCSTCSGSGYVY